MPLAMVTVTPTHWDAGWHKLHATNATRVWPGIGVDYRRAEDDAVVVAQEVASVVEAQELFASAELQELLSAAPINGSPTLSFIDGAGLQWWLPGRQRGLASAREA